MDFINYPNYNHLETISSAEKFAVWLFGDFNKINLKYDINQKNFISNSLKLFKDIFVNNNKENCFLSINEKIIDLKKSIKLSDFFDIENTIITNCPFRLEVKLLERKNKVMTNLSFMFYGISSLNSESNFSDFNTINITNMSYMFYNCSSLQKLPDISNFNTKNVNDMSYMFYNCSSLKELDYIKEWDVENIEKTDYMFCGCESLILLPDISDWNVSKLQYINGMFKNCKSLKKLFDTKKWEEKIRKNIKQDEILEGCDSLEFQENKKDKIKEMLSKLFNFLRFKCFDKLYFPFIYLIKLIILIYIGFVIFKLFQSIYYSFNINETNKCINNPDEYLMNYLNKTNITEYEEDELSILYDKILEISDYKYAYFEGDKNKTQKLKILLEPFNKKIENISEELDIAFDSFLSKEFSENLTNKTEENITQNFLLNTSYYEEVAKFNSSQKFFKIFTTVNIISAFIPIVILIFIYVKYNSLNERKLTIFFGLTIVFVMFSIISGLINYFIMDKLYDSLQKFLNGIEEEYELDIPQVIINEKINIQECQVMNMLIIFFSIFYIICLLIGLCVIERNNAIMNRIPKKYKKLLSNVEEAD